VVRADFGGAAGNEMLGEQVERPRQALVCGYARLPETRAGAAAAAVARSLAVQ